MRPWPANPYVLPRLPRRLTVLRFQPPRLRFALILSWKFGTSPGAAAAAPTPAKVAAPPRTRRARSR